MPSCLNYLIKNHTQIINVVETNRISIKVLTYLKFSFFFFFFTRINMSKTLLTPSEREKKNYVCQKVFSDFIRKF